MTDGDYERAEEEIEDLESEIEFEYGESYDDLSPTQQREAISDHFFNGNPKHKNSVERLRTGINHIRGARQIDEDESYFSSINRGGKSYMVVRDKATGRIRQWVRDE